MLLSRSLLASHHNALSTYLVIMPSLAHRGRVIHILWLKVNGVAILLSDLLMNKDIYKWLNVDLISVIFLEPCEHLKDLLQP